MRFILYFSILILLIGGCSDPTEWQLTSPDGKIILTLKQESGYSDKLVYKIDFKDNDSVINVIKPSSLGIIREDTEFTYNLRFVKAEITPDKLYEYEMIKGKRLKNKVYSNGIILSFENKDNKSVQFVFEVFNDGVGFKYRFPDTSVELHTVIGELTEFSMNEGTAWIQPYDTLGVWSPAYEYGYISNMKTGTKPPLSTGWGFPALFHSNGLWSLISETGLNETYCGSHLAANCSDNVYRIEYPFDWENYGMWERFPSSVLPWETPWRIIIIGNNPGTILESNLAFHLAEPSVLDHTEWIRPGISSWNWWSDHSGGWKFHSLKAFVEFSAEMGWDYSLVDAEWHRMQGGTIEELADFAEKKGVGLMLWYNSGGQHTRVMDAGPRDRMHLPDLRQNEMEKISKLGIKGIKVDFFQGEKQELIKLYRDIVNDASSFQLLVNTHGSTIPRGWDRTWPNLITMEAVRGAELYSDPNYAEMAVCQNTILPFTRNVIGSMDYTPVTFSDYTPETRHITTNAHELALSVIFESGVQHFADRIESFRSQPSYVRNFLRTVPVTWDETFFIDGFPGEYVILCRNKGNVYYLAGINGKMEYKEVVFNLPFLSGSDSWEVDLIKDEINPGEFDVEKIIVSSRDSILLNMLPGGGFVATICAK